jgi:hypothetical protein
MESRYRPGTIVHARGREWIVLPEREPEVLRLRPLTTAQGDEVGLFLPLEGERVRPTRFADPQPVSGGDATGIMTLFDEGFAAVEAGKSADRRRRDAEETGGGSGDLSAGALQKRESTSAGAPRQNRRQEARGCGKRRQWLLSFGQHNRAHRPPVRRSAAPGRQTSPPCLPDSSRQSSTKTRSAISASQRPRVIFPV